MNHGNSAAVLCRRGQPVVPVHCCCRLSLHCSMLPVRTCRLSWAELGHTDMSFGIGHRPLKGAIVKRGVSAPEAVCDTRCHPKGGFEHGCEMIPILLPRSAELQATGQSSEVPFCWQDVCSGHLFMSFRLQTSSPRADTGMLVHARPCRQQSPPAHNHSVSRCK